MADISHTRYVSPISESDTLDTVADRGAATDKVLRAGGFTTEALPNADLDINGTTRLGDSATNYAAFASDGKLTLVGAARVEKHLRVGAASWTKGSPAPSEGFEGVFVTLDFDNSTDDEAFYTLVVPSWWDSSIDVIVHVEWFYDGGGSPGTVEDAGTVCWALEYLSIKDGENITAAGTTIAKTSAGNHFSDRLVRTYFSSKILASNLEAGDTMGLRLYRDVDGGGDSGDSMAAIARLVHVHFHFVQNKFGQSLP